MLKRHHLSIFFLILSILACNLPGNAQEPGQIIPTETLTPKGPSAAFTIAALTVEAQLTKDDSAPQTIQDTPVPPVVATTAVPQQPVATTAQPGEATATPKAGAVTPTQNCDKIEFVKDVTVPDGTAFAPETSFTKTWRIKNAGTCTWSGSYSLVYFSGDKMDSPDTQALPGSVNPGDSVDITVNLKSPTRGGTYTGYWKLRNASGVLFGQLYAMIKVEDSSGGKFAVTRVELGVAGSCGSFTVTATITVNGPGQVTYKWIYSDGAVDTVSHPALNFTEAGSKTVSMTWNTSAAGSKWVDIYIDSPNHQQFGRASFSCP